MNKLFKVSKKLSCTEKEGRVVCSDKIVNKLESKLGIKLRATKADDTVNGHVTISHSQPPEKHEILVEIYETDEAPNESHKSTLKKPSKDIKKEDVEKEV